MCGVPSASLWVQLVGQPFPHADGGVRIQASAEASTRVRSEKRSGAYLAGDIDDSAGLHRAAIERVGALQGGEGAAEVAVGDAAERRHGAVAEAYALRARDRRDAVLHDALMQGLEPELGAAARQRLDDAGDVVTDEAEAGDGGVRLHDAAQRVLRILDRHAASALSSFVYECRLPQAKSGRLFTDSHSSQQHVNDVHVGAGNMKAIRTVIFDRATARNCRRYHVGDTIHGYGGDAFHSYAGNMMSDVKHAQG